MVLSRTRLAGEKTTIGGLEENKLKNENGLRFTFPALSIVEARQIGRGAMACCSQFWRCIGGSVFNSIFIFTAEEMRAQRCAELKIIVLILLNPSFNKGHIKIYQVS